MRRGRWRPTTVSAGRVSGWAEMRSSTCTASPAAISTSCEVAGAYPVRSTRTRYVPGPRSGSVNAPSAPVRVRTAWRCSAPVTCTIASGTASPEPASTTRPWIDCASTAAGSASRSARMYWSFMADPGGGTGRIVPPGNEC